jgi:hypothetical protein
MKLQPPPGFTAADAEPAQPAAFFDLQCAKAVAAAFAGGDGEVEGGARPRRPREFQLGSARASRCAPRPGGRAGWSHGPGRPDHRSHVTARAAELF